MPAVKRSTLDQFVETLLTHHQQGETEKEGQAPHRDTPSNNVVARLLAMPLNQFQREGDPMEIKVPWFDAPLWFVPSAAEAEGLVKQGVSRGRVWTAKELLDLLAIPGVTREQVKKVAMAKAIFQGELLP